MTSQTKSWRLVPEDPTPEMVMKIQSRYPGTERADLRNAIAAAPTLSVALRGEQVENTWNGLSRSGRTLYEAHTWAREERNRFAIALLAEVVPTLAVVDRCASRDLPIDLVEQCARKHGLQQTPELLAFLSEAIGLALDQRRRNHEGE